MNFFFHETLFRPLVVGRAMQKIFLNAIRGTVFRVAKRKTMAERNNPAGGGGRHEHPLRREIPQSEQERARVAHEQADHDMEEDPDLSIHSPNDDLDEGESARLGEDTSGII
jgi:hypothetical protein